MERRARFGVICCLLILTSVTAFSVTLPSTSYTPFAGYEDSYSNEESVSFVKLPASSFVNLGAVDDWINQCAANYPGPENMTLCNNCCTDNIEYVLCPQWITDPSADCDNEQEADSKSKSCKSNCGRSLPLDGSEWVLILMVVLAVALKIELATRLDK